MSLHKFESASEMSNSLAGSAVSRRTLLFVVSHSDGGGVQEIWSDVAEGFVARGFDARLIALYPHNDSASVRVSGMAWNYVVGRKPHSLGTCFDLLRSLIRLLRREAPEFVFTAMPAANVLVSAAAILAGVRTRMVVSHHSPVDTYKPLLNAVDGVLGLLWHVKAIVSVSSAVEASLDTKPRAYRAKRQTIHNALPPRIEAQLGTLAVGERRCRVVSRKVVATGRLAVQKNYPVLVRASAEMPDVEVLIIGAGPDEEMLKTLAHELGVEQRIRFLGQFPRDEALKLLAAGDVFVQPSLFEGHSLGLIEAAKLAMPLVVSNVPVQIEGITASDGTRCGIVVDPHDPMALASEIRRLLDEPEHYRHWAERARHLASSSSFDDMLTAYAALIT